MSSLMVTVSRNNGFFYRTGKVHVAGVREHAYPYPVTDVNFIYKVRMGRGCAVISHGYSKYQ